MAAMAVTRSALHARPTQAGHRVTSLELFFDLVYVFAFTQVTAWIAHERTALGTAQGVVTLAVLWWMWAGWSWLGNTFHADHGVPMLGFLASAAAIFALSLTIREVWEADGGTVAPVAFAGCYLVVRALHAGVYLWSARADARLRRQVLITAGAWMPSAVLLGVGALLSPQARLWWWTGTLALDLLATWILAVKGPGWAIRSPEHFAERFGLIVILALGESVVAVGVAAQSLEFEPALIGLAVLGVGAAVALWWPYFKDIAPAVEHRIVAADPERQVDIARESYTYLHLPLVAGIVLAASGVEEAVLALHHHEHAGIAGFLLAIGAAVFCAAGAALMALARATWTWLAASAAFFGAATVWMPHVQPVLAIGVTALTLIVVGLATAKVSASHSAARHP